MRPTTRRARLTASGRELVVRVIVTVEAPEVGPTVRSRPSQKLRVAAAQVRVSSDRQVHRRTPSWIEDLARSGGTGASVGLRQGDRGRTGRLGRWRRR